MKRVVLFALLTVMFIGVSIAWSLPGGSSFNDLDKSHWAYEHVMKLTEDGIISGYPDGSFKPEKTVTYGEFLKMATVAADVISSNEIAKEGEHWSVPYFEAGLNNMYFTRSDISIVAFDIPIPRKDMALISAGIIGEKMKVSDFGDYSTILNSIHDIDARHTHEFHIVKAYATGVLTGYPDGSFKPDGALTRAEAATVIKRLINLLKGEGNQLEDTNKSDADGLIPYVPENPKSVWREDINDLVAVVENPIGFPEGALELLMFNYSKNTNERHAELGEILKNRFPDEANAMLETLIKFASKPLANNEQGLRKQYFGEYPVLIDHVLDTVGIYIYPIGYNGKYWDTKPGQINEYFF